MTEGKRVYRSELRAEQARRTRAVVLDAATRCFVDRGYAATTMRDVAEAAGVSVQTVFAQGGKAALLLACVDRALTGDDERAPVVERELFTRLFAEQGKAAKLRVFREIALRYIPQTGPMMRAFGSAAAADAEVATAWAEYRRRRHQDSRAVVGTFAPWLREDVDLDRATDVFWAVFDHATPEALIGERGWSLEAYVDWQVDAFDRLLLRSGGGRRSGAGTVGAR